MNYDIVVIYISLHTKILKHVATHANHSLNGFVIDFKVFPSNKQNWE